MPAMRQTRRAPMKRAPAPRGRPRAPRRTDSHAWTMKLGAWAHARMRAAQYDGPTRKILVGFTLTSVLAIFVLLAAGLGILDDLGRGIQTSAGNTARSAGLAVRVINVQAPNGTNLSEYQRAEAEVKSGVMADDVMFGIDPSDVRARVAELPWVEQVVVRRLWPDQIQILITPRAATALWQDQGHLSFMDGTGRKLGEAKNTKSAKGYALVVGSNAGPQAPALFEALRASPDVANRTSAALWVGDRRWTLRLKSGGDILLPETGMAEALAHVQALQASHQILDREFARLDLRTSGTLILRPTPKGLSVTKAQEAAKSAQKA